MKTPDAEYEAPIRFDIYGRFELELRRENGQWLGYRSGLGLRRREPAVNFPASVAVADLATLLDDLFHELAAPGQTVRQIV